MSEFLIARHAILNLQQDNVPVIGTLGSGIPNRCKHMLSLHGSQKCSSEFFFYFLLLESGSLNGGPALGISICTLWTSVLRSVTVEKSFSSCSRTLVTMRKGEGLRWVCLAAPSTCRR